MSFAMMQNFTTLQRLRKRFTIQVVTRQTVGPLQKLKAEIHNSTPADSWFTAEIEADIHNSSCESTDSWFTAEIEAEIHNSTPTDSWFTVEIEADVGSLQRLKQIFTTPVVTR